MLRDVLRQKCAYKAIAVPTFDALVSHRESLEAMWSGHACRTSSPCSLHSMISGMPFLKSSPGVMGAAEIPQRALIQHGTGEIAVRARVLPISVPLRSRSTLEVIRFAAANHLCVDLTYDGSVRRIEPYSLRQTVEGNFVLHAIRSDSGDHRSYRIDRMQSAAVTSQVFTPRYAVELTSTGPLAVAPSTTMPDIASARRTARTRRQAPTYIYRCTVCRKTFNRQSMDGSLNSHKNPRGYPCPGRYGVYVRTKY